MKKTRYHIKKMLKGFGLVEFMVAFTIVTILSNVAFETYVDMRDEAHDASVKATFDSLRAAAADEAFDYDPYSFAHVCSGGVVDLTLRDLGHRDGIIDSDYQCTASVFEWVAIYPLKSESGYFCSDGTGFSGVVSGFLDSTAAGNINCSHATIAPTPVEVIPEPPPESEIPPTPQNEAPTLSLNGANPFHFWSQSANPFTGVGVGANKYNEPGYVATDPEDGSLNASVVITGPTLYSTTGPNNCKVYTHTISYAVADSEGVSAETQIRNVVHHKCKSTNDPLYVWGDDDNDPADDGADPGGWYQPFTGVGATEALGTLLAGDCTVAKMSLNGGGNSMNLTSMGSLYLSNVRVATVWRLRNPTNSAINSRLTSGATTVFNSLSLPANTDVYVKSSVVTGSATHTLTNISTNASSTKAATTQGFTSTSTAECIQ